MSESQFEKGKRAVNRTVRAKAPAKVNLHLEVLRRRHDGYHEVETVLQAVSIFDELSVTLVEEYAGGAPDIELTVDAEQDIPADETNLCWQAAELFCEKTGRSGRLVMHLEKGIPAMAGLGGGSSDAAAVLMACDRLFGTKLEPAQLEKMGAELGADVPFFVRGGTALGRGTGATLTALPSVRTGQFLIVKPDLELSTADVYGNLKMGLTVNSSKASIGVIKPILARFPQKTWPGFNRLEEAVLPQQPLLQRLVLQLREAAPVAMLSGSGSAVVAVFRDGEDLTGLTEDLTEAGLYVRNVRPHTSGVAIKDD